MELNTYSDNSDSAESRSSTPSLVTDNVEIAVVVNRHKSESISGGSSKESSPSNSRAVSASPERSPSPAKSPNSEHPSSREASPVRIAPGSPVTSEPSQSSSSISPIRSKSPSPAPSPKPVGIVSHVQGYVDRSSPVSDRSSNRINDNRQKWQISPEVPRSKKRYTPDKNSGERERSYSPYRNQPSKHSKPSSRSSDKGDSANRSRNSRDRESPTHDLFDEFDARNYRTGEDARNSNRPESAVSSHPKKEQRRDRLDERSDRKKPFSSYEEPKVNRERVRDMDSTRDLGRTRESTDRGKYRTGSPSARKAPRESVNNREREDHSRMYREVESQNRETVTERLQHDNVAEKNMPSSSSDSDSDSKADEGASPADRLLDDSDSDESLVGRGKTVSERNVNDIEVERRKRTVAEMEKEREEPRAQRERDRHSERERMSQRGRVSERERPQVRDREESAHRYQHVSNTISHSREKVRDRSQHARKFESRENEPSSRVRSRVDKRETVEHLSDRSVSNSPPTRSIVSVVHNSKSLPTTVVATTSTKPKKSKKKKKKRDKSNMEEPKRIIVKNDRSDLKQSVFNRLNMEDDSEKDDQSESTINITFDQGECFVQVFQFS